MSPSERRVVESFEIEAYCYFWRFTNSTVIVAIQSYTLYCVLTISRAQWQSRTLHMKVHNASKKQCIR